MSADIKNKISEILNEADGEQSEAKQDEFSIFFERLKLYQWASHNSNATTIKGAFNDRNYRGLYFTAYYLEQLDNYIYHIKNKRWDAAKNMLRSGDRVAKRVTETAVTAARGLKKVQRKLGLPEFQQNRDRRNQDELDSSYQEELDKGGAWAKI